MPDQNDGLSAITYFSSWITNADTKIGFLAAGITAVGAAECAALSHFINSNPFHGARSQIAGALLLASLPAMLYAILNLIRALRPRTDAPVSFTRYAFPALARENADFVPKLDSDLQRTEAWAEAHALARIASKKFQHLGRGLDAFMVAALLLGLAAAIIP